jgi:hypothetical protein
VRASEGTGHRSQVAVPSSSSSLLLSDRRSESLFPSLLPLPELPSLDPVVEPEPLPFELVVFFPADEEDDDAAPVELLYTAH